MTIKLEQNFWIKNMNRYPWMVVNRYPSDDPVMCGGEPTGQYWMEAEIISYHKTYEAAEKAFKKATKQ